MTEVARVAVERNFLKELSVPLVENLLLSLTGTKARIGVLVASLDLEDEEVIEVYRERMKIEETFRDWKSYNGLEKMMFRKREILEKMLLVLMLAYVIFTLLGEMLKEKLPLNPLEKRRKSGYFLMKFEIHRFVNELSKTVWRAFILEVLRPCKWNITFCDST